VRTDKEVESELVAADMERERWAGEAHSDWMRRDGGEISLSISGFERNRLFLNLGGKQFEDISGVSGLDALGDGRAFAVWDYDRDGWQDIALVNANAPLLSVFRNEIGRNAARNAIAVRLVGGNHASRASSVYGPRDGYGAAVTAYVAGQVPILREHRCGEGLAAQNSSTLLIGIGDHGSVDSLAVRWPNGTVQHTGEIEARTVVTVYENPAHSPSGEAFVAQPYVPAQSPPSQRSPVAAAGGVPVLAAVSGEIDSEEAPALRMFTSTATWCPSCKASLPQLSLLRESFDTDGLEMSGVPVDLDDSAAKLEAYVQRYRPAYRLRTDWSSEQIAAFSEILVRETGLDALPSTLVTDAAGRLLLAVAGVPNVSQLRRLLAEDGRQQRTAQ